MNTSLRSVRCFFIPEWNCERVMKLALSVNKSGLCFTEYGFSSKHYEHIEVGGV